VSKELVFHIAADRKKDSILEKEITYNKKGQIVEIRRYAVPSKEGLIRIDSFYYNDKKLLEIEKRYTYYGLPDTSQTKYEYDLKGNEVAAYSWRNNVYQLAQTLEYDDNDRLKKNTFLDGLVEDRIEEYFYSLDDNPDSMRVFLLKKWEYTTIFKYDSIYNTRTATIRYPKSSWLRSRIEYNKNNFVKDLLIYKTSSWNQSKLCDLEVKHVLNPDDTISECIFYLNGKRKFSKRHIYIAVQ
jgi:hypothetical protein